MTRDNEDELAVREIERRIDGRTVADRLRRILDEDRELLDRFAGE